MKQLIPRQNPLLQDHISNPLIDASKLATAQHLSKSDRRTFIRRYVRGETARQALTDWKPPLSLFGFTRGQFSLVDLVISLLERSGPAELDLSTWTAASADVSQLNQLLKAGKITKLRMLLDNTFVWRRPEIMKTVVELFGNNAIRVTENHAKFFTITTADFAVTCKTSMNLNHNARFEDFDITCDPGLHEFLREMFDELWAQSFSQPWNRQQGRKLWKTHINPDGL